MDHRQIKYPGHINMRTFMRITLLTILLTVCYIPVSNAYTKSRYYESGKKGYELVLDMKYHEADNIFDEMIGMEPKNAIGYLYKSQSYFHYWQYTFLDPDQKALKQFKTLLFKTKDLAEAMLDEDNVETLFVLGSAYGNIGLYYANTNSWLRAFWYGRKGIKYMTEAVEKDPEYYNAYYCLGIFNYYAATLPKVVKALSFLIGKIEGDREKAIRQLMIASEKSELKGDAKIFLADSVYYEERNFEKALPLLEELKIEYPDNHYISLALAVSCRNLNRYDLSVRTLNASLHSESLRKFPYLDGDIYYNLGRAYSGMNEYDRAISSYKKAYKISKNLKGVIPHQFDAWSLYEIGDAYEMLGSINEARKYYSKIKRNNRNAYESTRRRFKNPLTPAQIKLIKGKNYLGCARYKKAKRILTGLINSEADDDAADNTVKAEALLYLGEVEYHLKEYEDSIRTLNKVFTIDDVRKEWIVPWSHYWLAGCYREIGEINRAEREYDIAYEYNNSGIRYKIDKARNDIKRHIRHE